MERQHHAFSLECNNFSDIRRRPLVIGKLDQVRLPFVVTMPQLAVGALTLGLLWLTRAGWGAIVSDRLHIVVFVVAPVVVAQQVSRTSVEGRPLSKAALGALRLLTAPRWGTVNGRRQRRPVTADVLFHPIEDRPNRGRRRRRPNPTDDRRTDDRRINDERASGKGVGR